MTYLSIIMPIYNEQATVRQAIERVLAVDFPCPVELVAVDDGSTDGTRSIISEFESLGVRRVFHPVNKGKGAAVRTGVQQARGTHVIILDADLEYSPADIATMIIPVIAGHADHVFGTRVFGLNTSFASFKFAVGGRFTTLVANVLFDSCVTDMHTCLKLLPVSDFLRLHLLENGFGLDTQLTARLLHAGVRPYEVPITYRGRSAAEGKKITWTDGVKCLWILAQVRFARRTELPSRVRTESALPQGEPAPVVAVAAALVPEQHSVTVADNVVASGS